MNVLQLQHSMAMGIVNKIKETMPTTTTSLKVAPKRIINHKNWNSPFQTRIYLVKVPLNVKIVQ